MQKRRLGISLYPERSTFEQDVAYMEKAAKLGFDLLFIALLGAGDRQQTIDRYKPLLAKAKELGFEIEADVNPMMFERMGIMGFTSASISKPSSLALASRGL